MLTQRCRVVLQNDIEPRFEFGFGLSYTEFTYTNLRISTIQQNDPNSVDLEANWAAGRPTPIEEGSSTAIWLHRPLIKVKFSVKNSGKVAGSEVCVSPCPGTLSKNLNTLITPLADTSAVPPPPSICRRAAIDS